MPRGRPGITPKVGVIKTPRKRLKTAGSFTKENPKPGPGRPPGSRNKFSGNLKQILLDAAANGVDGGGALDYFILQARQPNPSPFMSLIGKCITQSSEQKVTGDIGFYWGQPVANSSQPEDLTDDGED
jgi:hypothetical protein